MVKKLVKFHPPKIEKYTGCPGDFGKIAVKICSNFSLQFCEFIIERDASKFSKLLKALARSRIIQAYIHIWRI